MLIESEELLKARERASVFVGVEKDDHDVCRPQSSSVVLEQYDHRRRVESTVNNEGLEPSVACFYYEI